MGQAILIRVEPENYDIWFREHSSHTEARKAYGITDGPLYRDVTDPNVTLVHLDVEDLGQAMQWFGSDEFRSAAARAGNVKREIWVAEQEARPHSAKGQS